MELSFRFASCLMPWTRSSLRTGNPHLVVGKAHATGLYRPGERRMVVLLGSEDRVVSRSYTFSKMFAASGGAYLSSDFFAGFELHIHRRCINITND